MPDLTEAEFAERKRAAESMIAKLTAFLMYDAEQRIRNRSFGQCSLTLFWRDGCVLDAEVNEKHALKTDRDGGIPRGVEKENR